MNPEAGEVWILRSAISETVVLVLGHEQPHPNGFDTMSLCLTLDTNRSRINLVEWWHNDWFVDELCERIA